MDKLSNKEKLKAHSREGDDGRNNFFHNKSNPQQAIRGVDYN